MMYDFSRSKVRKNGLVLDKFALALELQSVLGYDRGLVYHIYNDTYTYRELKDVLFNAILNNESYNFRVYSRN